MASPLCTALNALCRTIVPKRVPWHPRGMLRITELKLPLHHADEALPAAICKRLRITPRELVRYVVARRAHDARDKTDIQLVYSVDVNVKDEAAVLARFTQGPQRPAHARHQLPVRRQGARGRDAAAPGRRSAPGRAGCSPG